ncbi:MAG: alcohol dehydrogenase catalytic domain-containing protein [Betaproteobacteria bacterium]|nr:alcohol dehydrogenase catalytic domain-containing protein [Betaproteobacteria bacterium]
MRALIKESPQPGIAYRDVPDPELKPGHVIVRVKSCGISGSEIARYRWTDAYHAGGAKDMSRQLPRIMGHEFSGTIAAVGPGVDNRSTGDLVVIQSVIGCGGCESCDAGLPNHCTNRVTIGVNADGGFAEYCAVPASNVYAVPAGVALENAALLQPFAIAAYSLEIGGIRPGERIGVWGVGAIGVSLIQQAIIGGATVEFAVGRDHGRLDAVRQLGVRHTISANDGDPSRRLVELFGGQKLDAIFEVSGHTPAINSALSLLKRRGRAILIGNLQEPFKADLLPAIMDQLSILTVRTYSLAAWRRALSLLPRVQNQPGTLPVERVPLAEGVAAFQRAASGEGIKFVLEP